MTFQEINERINALAAQKGGQAVSTIIPDGNANLNDTACPPVLTH